MSNPLPRGTVAGFAGSGVCGRIVSGWRRWAAPEHRPVQSAELTPVSGGP